MLILHGRKTAKIKKFTDNLQHCPFCKTFDLQVEVYRDYYHLYFIPLVALGDKSAKIRCKSCGEPIRSETREKEYIISVRTPFYLYSFPILIAVTIALVIGNDYYNRSQTNKYLEHPEINDVYSIKSNANKFDSYYFTKIIAIEKDSIRMLHNKFEYLFLQANFSEEDYFVKEDTIFFSKMDLKRMLDSSEITVINRDYNEQTGFKRIK